MHIEQRIQVRRTSLGMIFHDSTQIKSSAAGGEPIAATDMMETASGIPDVMAASRHKGEISAGALRIVGLQLGEVSASLTIAR